MKNLFLLLFTLSCLNGFSQQEQFEVLEPISFSGLNSQTVLDSIHFIPGDIVPYKESFGVLVIEKGDVTVRTDYKYLKKLADDGKIKLSEAILAPKTLLTAEETLLKKINNKLNFLVGATVISVGAGIISLINLLRSE
ncbi:MAG: hypothetical protein AAF927_21030 [Bacteroidota bacterium]